MLAVSGAGCLAGAVLLSRHRDDPGGAWTLAGCGVALLLMAALGAPLRFELLEEGLEVGYLLRSRRYPWDQLERQSFYGMSIEALRLRFARGELCLLQTAVASPIRDLAELLARRHPALPRDW